MYEFLGAKRLVLNPRRLMRTPTYRLVNKFCAVIMFTLRSRPHIRSDETFKIHFGGQEVVSVEHVKAVFINTLASPKTAQMSSITTNSITIYVY